MATKSTNGGTETEQRGAATQTPKINWDDSKMTSSYANVCNAAGTTEASAYKVGDRIIMLYDGNFIADGTPEEIRAWPDDRVQRFIAGKASEEDLKALHSE